MSDKEIEFDLSRLKKIIWKNNYTAGFSLLAIFFGLISLLVFFKIYLLNNALFQLFYSLPVGIWISLTLFLILSAIAAYYEKYGLMFVPVLIWILFTTSFVRTQNIPGLKDVTTGDWTLGPDLDPFLYLRHATEIFQGTLENPDMMRSAPLGSNNYASNNIMPWAILGLYKLISLFTETTLTYAAIIAPVIFSVVATLLFFLFTNVLFSFKFSKGKAALGATIASLFYIFNPQMIHRTTAGIPEIESLGMVWFWSAFLLFTLAWKQEDARKRIIFGSLAGLFTGLMFWTWGGYRYIYMTISLATLGAFLFQIEPKKNFQIFSSWVIVAILAALIREGNLRGLITSISGTGLALSVLFIMLVDRIINKKEIKNLIRLERLNFSRSILSLIASIALGAVLLLVIYPSFILGLFSSIIDSLLHPFGGGRVGLTVAENVSPYFVEVFQNFGHLFWAFFVGSLIIFYESIKHFGKKKFLLNLFFIIFLTSFIFSRISPESKLNGNNSLSQILYLGGVAAFGFILIYTYIKAYRRDEKLFSDFSKIKFHYLLMLSFSVLAIISMRGAVRLFFIIAPIIIIITSYFIIRSLDYILSIKDRSSRNIMWVVFAITMIIVVHVFSSHSLITTQEAKSTIPSIYYQQWQKAMSWVRESTPVDSIFVHWWDYGYWVQTLGERPTLTDGGHPSFAFTYESARYILTTSQPETALSMMKSLNLSYLLIDSTDFGKYPAYSKIGSNESWDRFSVLATMVIDKGQSQVDNESRINVYHGINGVDQDIVYKDERGQTIFIPGPTYDENGNPQYKSFVIGAVVESSTAGGVLSFVRPSTVFFYNNNQYRIPTKYIYYQGQLLDFGTGLDAVLEVIPQAIDNQQGGVEIDASGALIYLSPRVKDTLFAQLYLMNDPLNRYPTIKRVHIQDDIIVSDLKSKNVDLDEFIYYQGFRGPIKIWDTREIPDNIRVREEFLDRETYNNIGQGNIPLAPFDDFEFTV